MSYEIDLFDGAGLVECAKPITWDEWRMFVLFLETGCGYTEAWLVREDGQIAEKVRL